MACVELIVRDAVQRNASKKHVWLSRIRIWEKVQLSWLYLVTAWFCDRTRIYIVSISFSQHFDRPFSHLVGCISGLFSCLRLSTVDTLTGESFITEEVEHGQRKVSSGERDVFLPLGSQGSRESTRKTMIYSFGRWRVRLTMIRLSQHFRDLRVP